MDGHWPFISFIVESINEIGHFRVTLCLCFKTSLRAKPFIWEWAWFAWKWTCRRNSFLYGFPRKLVFTRRHKVTWKWPIVRGRNKVSRVVIRKLGLIPLIGDIRSILRRNCDVFPCLAKGQRADRDMLEFASLRVGWSWQREKCTRNYVSSFNSSGRNPATLDYLPFFVCSASVTFI